MVEERMVRVQIVTPQVVLSGDFSPEQGMIVVGKDGAHLRFGGRWVQVVGSGVTASEVLRSGATSIVDAFGEVHDPVAALERLVESLGEDRIREAAVEIAVERYAADSDDTKAAAEQLDDEVGKALAADPRDLARDARVLARTTYR